MYNLAGRPVIVNLHEQFCTNFCSRDHSLRQRMSLVHLVGTYEFIDAAPLLALIKCIIPLLYPLNGGYNYLLYRKKGKPRSFLDILFKGHTPNLAVQMFRECVKL